MNPGWRNNYLRYKSYFLNTVERYRERSDIRAYIEILLSLTTVSIFAVFALRPTLLTISGLIKEIETKRHTLEQMQTKIDNLTTAQTLYDRERSKINILSVSVPDKPNPDIFARQMEGLSQKHGLEIQKIAVDEAVITGNKTAAIGKESKNLDPFPEGSVSLSVSAAFRAELDRYIAFSNLISDFEKLLRPAKIDTIRIQTSSSDKENKILELTLEARLPYNGKDKN